MASKPMRETTYFILASLMDEARHGYGIIQRSRELSDGVVNLAAGTLYGALDRLVLEGLIRADSEEIVNGRARRYYALTPDGQDAVVAEAERLSSAATAVERLAHQIANTRTSKGKK